MSDCSNVLHLEQNQSVRLGITFNRFLGACLCHYLICIIYLENRLQCRQREEINYRMLLWVQIILVNSLQ